MTHYFFPFTAFKRDRAIAPILPLVLLGVNASGLVDPAHADIVIPDPTVAPAVAPQLSPSQSGWPQPPVLPPSDFQPGSSPSPRSIPANSQPIAPVPQGFPAPQESVPSAPLSSPPEVAQPTTPPASAAGPNLADQPEMTTVVTYVNPNAPMAQDMPGAGSEQVPYRTITYALQQAKPGTVVQLMPGTYAQPTGEVFPLVVPPWVTLRGDRTQAQAVQIIGGGVFISRTFASQNMAILVGKNTIVEGVTVSNPNVRGTGIWVESTNPLIRNCLLTKNHREGIFVTGTANPKITNNTFIANGGDGISVTSQAMGEITANVFENTGFGLAIGQNSAPIVDGNRITGNVDGIYINDAAQPVLRNNVIEANQHTGIVVTIRARPNLGTIDSHGNNTIRGNGKFDLLNGTKQEIIYAIGNLLDPKRVSGRFVFEMPPSAVMPPVLTP